MKTPFRTSFHILTLILSLALNIILIRSSIYYYRLYLKLSLDPLGLSRNADTDNSLPHHLNRVFLLGDSRARSWPIPQLESPLHFINLGVSGHTSSQMLARFRQLSLPLSSSDIVVVQVGINDLKTIPFFPGQKLAIQHSCSTNINKISQIISDSQAKLVLTTIIPVGSIPLTRRFFWNKDIDTAILKCNESIRSLSSNRVHILDTSFLADPSGRLRPEYQLNQLHLNSVGYNELNKRLVPLLNSQRSIYPH